MTTYQGTSFVKNPKTNKINITDANNILHSNGISVAKEIAKVNTTDEFLIEYVDSPFGKKKIRISNPNYIHIPEEQIKSIQTNNNDYNYTSTLKPGAKTLAQIEEERKKATENSLKLMKNNSNLGLSGFIGKYDIKSTPFNIGV